MEAQYSSEAAVFFGKIQRRLPQKAVALSVTARVFLLCSCIRRERTVAKSDYWFRHVRPSAYNSAAPSGRIFVKFYIGNFHESQLRNSIFG